jgi:hypothetical protein
VDSSKLACKGLSENDTQCSHPVVANSDYCWKHGNWFALDLEIIRMVDQHFRDEASLFWQRSNFFLLAEAILFSTVVSTIQGESGLDRSLVIIVSAFGLVLTAFWYMAGSTGRKWLGHWRDQRIELSETFDRYQRDAKVERIAKEPWTTATQITQYLPLLFVLGWMGLVIQYLIR